MSFYPKDAKHSSHQYNHSSHFLAKVNKISHSFLIRKSSVSEDRKGFCYQTSKPGVNVTEIYVYTVIKRQVCVGPGAHSTLASGQKKLCLQFLFSC